MGLLPDQPQVLEAPKRDALGRLLPGQRSINPGGRTKRFKGLAAAVRARTNDGEELVEFALDVFRNEKRKYKHSDVWAAFIWLAERGFGKAPQLIEIDAGGFADLDISKAIAAASGDELEQMESQIGMVIARIKGE